MTLGRSIIRAYWAVGDLEQRVTDAARIALGDGLAVMTAAVTLEPATKPFLDHAQALGGTGPARIIGRGRSVTAPMAALANGALAHALDFEDTFEPGMIHPNASLIPAVLALAQAQGATGGAVLKALAIGCDFACRLSLALDGDPAQRGWYHPPVLSGLGATLGSAHLLGLSEGQALDALGLFIAQFMLSDELKRSPHSHLRAVREGLAARAAVEGALLAAAGVRAVDRPLEGESGIFAQLTGNRPREGALTGGLGESFAGPDVSIKRWPSCRGTHSAIVAALALRDRNIHASQILRVMVVATPPNDMLFMPRENRIAPATAIDAKFSIPFVFAAALAHGSIDLGTFADTQLCDPSILDLARRVELQAVHPSDGFEARYEVELLDGDKIVEEVVTVPEWRVSTMGLADLRPKFADCLERAGRTDLDGFLGALADVERSGIGPLMELL